LEQKIYEYFYSGDTELRLSYLTTIKQKHNEPTADCIRRFRDTRNQCFNLNIYDKDLANLAYSGLSPHLKEKLESHAFFMLARSYKELQIVKVEPKSLEAYPGVVISLGTSVKLTWLSIEASHWMTKEDDMCVAKWNWGSKSKPFVCSSL
jgi:hypothetical protein